MDEEEEKIIKQAAVEVRTLVNTRVGSIKDFQAADSEFRRVVEEEDRSPRLVLDPVTYKRGGFYQQLKRGEVGFHILWVAGNYEKAEQSFLKINKGGRPLSTWETDVVENRHSSFIRTVMSISSLSSATHYWHTKDLEEGITEEHQKKIDDILAGINKFHETLFLPTYETPIRRLQQPLFVSPDVQTKPLWLSQLLAVIEKGKGQQSEIQKLIERDKNTQPLTIIDSGLKLIQNALNASNNIVGPSPKSLSVVPALYFYTEAGRYVRSLLFGLLYWLLNGTDEDILNRKRVFSIHRASFEQILLDNKEDVVTGITRKTGSGQEVTGQTARYYQGLLELLITHKDDIHSNSFAHDYANLAKELTNKASKVRISSGKSRIFTPNQKSTLILENFFYNPNRCGICNGILDPSSELQHDHIHEHAKGGKTLLENQRLVHPFCNNPANREVIEDSKNGNDTVKLPYFTDPEFGIEATQLKLFQDFR